MAAVHSVWREPRACQQSQRCALRMPVLLLSLLAAALVLVVVLPCAAADEQHLREQQEQQERQPGVPMLDAASFDSATRSGVALVVFVAPDCAPCMPLADALADAAHRLRGHTAQLVMVDGTAEPELAERMAVQEYPSIRVFVDGEHVVEHRGSRDADTLVRLVERALQPAFEIVESAAALDELLKQHPDTPVVVGVAPESAARKKLMRTALLTHDFARGKEIRIAVAYNPEYVETHVTLFPGQFALLQPAARAGSAKGKDAKAARIAVRYDPTQFDSLEDFVKSSFDSARFPEFSYETAEHFLPIQNPIVFGFFKDRNDPMKAILKKVALTKSMPDKVTFAWADAEAMDTFLKFMGLSDAPIPIAAYSFAGDVRYRLPATMTDLTEDALGAWIDSLIAGDVLPSPRSQPVPAVQNETGPYVVVGDTWRDIVEDMDKDVVIAQVAEWCKYCREFKPVYSDIADSFRDAGISSVVIASMDAAENDAPEPYKAKELPAIHLFPAGSKRGIIYSGPFSREDIVDFIKSKAATAFHIDESQGAPDDSPPLTGSDEDTGELKEFRGLVEGFADHEDLEVRKIEEHEDLNSLSDHDEL